MQTQRNMFDLSHFVHTCGKIGRLQTLSVVPVIAGDSFEIDLDGIIRLAPLRKEVVNECQVDILAFYVPYRHVYGSDWVNFLMRGKDENVSFSGQSVAATDTDLSYLALQESSLAIPNWLYQSYNMIWDRYFRVPHQASLPVNNFPSGSSQDNREIRKYGRRCARLPHPTNGGVRIDNGSASDHRDLSSQDWEVSAGSVLDIRALEQVKARYRSEIERAWFAERYTDVLDIWRSEVNIDADQRPELCYRETFLMSGMDVDGTDDATLGQYIGKTVARAGFRMPRKWFPEHGSFWVMALLRFPLVHAFEKHLLQTFVSPSYTEWAADPSVMAAEPPLPFNPSNYVSGQALGGGFGITPDPQLVEPYGQWYRRHPNNVHQHFANIPGYPFSKHVFTSEDQLFYYQLGEYDDVFHTSQLGHWQMHSRVNLNALRNLPEATRSIFAGA